MSFTKWRPPCGTAYTTNSKGKSPHKVLKGKLPNTGKLTSRQLLRSTKVLPNSHVYVYPGFKMANSPLCGATSNRSRTHGVLDQGTTMCAYSSSLPLWPPTELWMGAQVEQNLSTIFEAQRVVHVRGIRPGIWMPTKTSQSSSARLGESSSSIPHSTFLPSKAKPWDSSCGADREKKATRPEA